LKESDPRRVTVETDELLRRMTAARPGNGSVSEFEFLCWGRRGGSGVKRAWWRYSAAIGDEGGGGRKRERRAGADDLFD